jgi:hypothetical protein
MQFPGVVEAVSEATAIEAAVALFALDDSKRRRLAVNLRRWAPHEGRAPVVRYTNQ